MLNIGQAAAASGVSAKMIRHYEEVGMLPAARRTASGYRQYGETDVQTLRFISRARGLGFSVKEVSALLALWHDKGRASHDVKSLALRHVEDIDRKIAELQGMRHTLVRLAEQCRGDGRPDCPILDDLARARRRPALARLAD